MSIACARFETPEMLQRNEEPIASLIGRVIQSHAAAGVHYRLERIVGEGGMGTAYLALREGPSGSAPVVVKVMREDPGLGEIAPDIVARKESVVRRWRARAPVPPRASRLPSRRTCPGTRGQPS